MIVGALRALLALEFLAGLGAWVLGTCHWTLAGVTMTGTLVAFMCSWGDEPGSGRWVPCTPPESRR